MLYIKEEKTIEVGGAKVVVNGRKITKADSPSNYELVQTIRKEFSDVFKDYGVDYNEDFMDVTIDGNNIVIRNEKGDELVNKKISDTMVLKNYV